MANMQSRESKYHRSPDKQEMLMRAKVLASCGFDIRDPAVAKTVHMEY